MSASASPSRASILLAFAALYIIWGSTYLGIRFAIDSIPPLLMAGTRYALAGALLYGYMRWKGEPAPTRQGWLTALIIGTCLLAFGNGGVTLGEQYIPSGLTALLVATVPMFLAVLGWWSGLASRPAPLVAVGLALGLGGVYLLARTPGASHVALPGNETLGISLVLIAALVWAIGSLYSKKHQPAPSPFVSGGMQMLCGGLVMLVAGLAKGEAAGFEVAQVTTKSWVAYAYLVTFGSIVAFTAYIWLLRVVEPALAGTYAFVNPVVAVLLGWAFAGEQLNTGMLGGAALIVVAVALVILGGRQKKLE
ncbi:Permease of the drug/metabolite transporter (DMT) superfamily [Hymenobacter gelipurpurascens]|uniref:Permease of the drug/metabolite transporter (DMT) superfamily n=1 Tax=Hymenobacter gelipurpurascens TaxID=89968 RepID=A0A212UDD8_9BACT|nr:drug/metabolite exporter YedA [Hymenobacter gelipurpurascens]SNC76213.1 Permease of the drug/metabolite transporter (DMT) superfamily [Hymenobacter gelipurpurascens]